MIRLSKSIAGVPTKAALIFLASATVATPQESVLDKLGDLETRLKDVEDRESRLKALEAQHFEHGVVSIKAVDTRSLTDSSRCPTDPNDAYRGTRGGSVTFATPFDKPPAVLMALRTLDIVGGEPNDTNRISLDVNSVDRTGFRYTFVTWCRTKVYSAEAVWFAFPAK